MLCIRSVHIIVGRAAAAAADAAGFRASAIRVGREGMREPNKRQKKRG